MLQGERLDYLAGFFDAEGTITSYLRESESLPVVMIEVNQKSDTRVLEEFREAFGGKIYFAKSGVRWNIHRKDEIDLFCFSMRSRCCEKSQQLEICIPFILSKRYIHQGMYASPALALHGEKLHKDLHLLKTHGPGYSPGAKGDPIDTRCLQYLAGAMDGDGCIRLHRVPTGYTPHLFYTGSYLPFIDYLCRTFGGCVRKGLNHKKQSYIWILTGSDRIFDIIHRISDLSVDKKDQYDLMVEYLERRKLMPDHDLPTEFKKYQTYVYDELRRLKKR